jgi:hypothetical protein
MGMVNRIAIAFGSGLGIYCQRGSCHVVFLESGMLKCDGTGSRGIAPLECEVLT